MKDEIKEMLDVIRNLVEQSPNRGSYGITHKKWKQLLDYITNLQEENEKLKEENKRIFSKVNDDELLISNAMNYAEAQDYKSRNEKIIRKISLYRMDDITMESNRILNDLLNVALGEDKDVKD